MTTMLMAPPVISETLSRRQADYVMAWRELWLDHVYWTRLAMMALVHDVPGADQTVSRLLRNADDMVGLLAPEYGMQTLEPLRELLKGHLTIAATLVSEARQGAASAEQTERDWHENADQIARFLSSANPYMEYADVRGMFESHLAMTKDEAVDRISGKWDEDIATYEEIQSMALMMADAMSGAVIRQFPNKFA